MNEGQQFRSLDVQSLREQLATQDVQRRTTASGLLAPSATQRPPMTNSPPVTGNTPPVTGNVHPVTDTTSPVTGNALPVSAFVGDRILPRPKPLPPTYDEAINTGNVIRETYLSAIYPPRYGAPHYPCDHSPSQVCYNCIESDTRRRLHNPAWRVRRTCRTWPLTPKQPIWAKIAFFLITFSFFLVVFAIMYNLLAVEAIFWYGDQTSKL